VQEQRSAADLLREATARTAATWSLEAKKQRAHLRLRLVELVVAVRRQYLSSGGKPLSHWDDIDARLRLALRTTGTLEALVERWLRDLRIPTPDSSVSLALCRLRDEVELQREAGWVASDRALFSLMDQQRALAMAEAREAVELAKAARTMEDGR
jgi:hypothetical protein